MPVIVTINNMSFVQFHDMHGGGSLKIKPFGFIYIEADSKEEAKIIFYNRFNRNPEKISCACCGEDYSISISSDLTQATAFERNCRYAYFDEKRREVSRDKALVIGKGLKDGYFSKYIEESGIYGKHETLNKYLKRKDVLVIYANDIKPEERIGEIRKSGWVYVD